MEFRDRFKLAAKHAGVEYSQTAIALSLDLERKQTVDRWMGDGLPSVKMLYRIADKWGVDPRWLGTGEGSSKLDAEKWSPAKELESAPAQRVKEPHWTYKKAAAATGGKTKRRTGG